MKNQSDEIEIKINLTMGQAQTLFNVMACFIEEPELFKSIWTTAKGRRHVRASILRFQHQLDRYYES